MSKEEWVEWDTIHWKPIIHYVPTVNLLANNWLLFVFIEEIDATRILGNLWTIQKGSSVLNHWHTDFNLLTERVTIQNLWVLLPTLPFPLWNKYILMGLANSIGRFVSLEKEFHLLFDK